MCVCPSVGLHVCIENKEVIPLSTEICLHLGSCLCVYKHFKDTLVHKRLITFRPLEEDEALVSLLIKTSLAKVTD